MDIPAGFAVLCDTDEHKCAACLKPVCDEMYLNLCQHLLCGRCALEPDDCPLCHTPARVATGVRYKCTTCGVAVATQYDADAHHCSTTLGDGTEGGTEGGIDEVLALANQTGELGITTPPPHEVPAAGPFAFTPPPFASVGAPPGTQPHPANAAGIDEVLDVANQIGELGITTPPPQEVSAAGPFAFTPPPFASVGTPLGAQLHATYAEHEPSEEGASDADEVATQPQWPPSPTPASDATEPTESELAQLLHDAVMTLFREYGFTKTDIVLQADYSKHNISRDFNAMVNGNCTRKAERLECLRALM